MDRLQTLALTVCALTATSCEDGPQGNKPAGQAVSRVEAIAAPKNQASESDFCDVLKPADSAPGFAFPPLDGDAPRTSGAWRWVNVWASWCGPCVEEMALIQRMRAELDAQGARVDLVLLSVDQTADAMKQFQASHAEAKGSLRLSDFKALEAWLPSVGLDAGATLPIHLFVDPQGKVRCARTGAVRDTDRTLIKKVLSG